MICVFLKKCSFSHYISAMECNVLITIKKEYFSISISCYAYTPFHLRTFVLLLVSFAQAGDSHDLIINSYVYLISCDHSYPLVTHSENTLD